MKYGQDFEGRQYFAPSITFLLIVDVLRIGIGFFVSEDRGSMIMIVPVYLIVSALYVGLTACVVHNRSIWVIRSAFKVGCILGLCQLVLTVLYYCVDIDWLAVNNRAIELTLFQQLVTNYWTSVSMYFISAIAVVAISLSKSD